MRVPVRPSRATSAIGLVVAAFMLVLGLAAGAPAIWMVFVLIIGGLSAVNAFTGRGPAVYEADVPGSASPGTASRLAELTRLRQQGLVSEQEFEAKRRQILHDL